MTTATLTLTDFLLARIAEDEAAATAATAGPWRWADDEPVLVSETAATRFVSGMTPFGSIDTTYPTYVLQPTYDDSGVDGTDADKAHIARWDPARVLAECEAKAKVVGLYLGSMQAQGDGRSGVRLAAVEMLTGVLGDALQALALPYADHPDFQQEWRS